MGSCLGEETDWDRVGRTKVKEGKQEKGSRVNNRVRHQVRKIPCGEWIMLLRE